MVTSLSRGFRPWAPGHEVPPSYNRAFLGAGDRHPSLQMTLSEAAHTALFHEARPYR